MLTLLRKKKIAKKVLWGLAVIIIPAFVLWGAGSLSKRSTPFKYIGTIDGKKVPVDEFVESIKDVQVGLFLSYFNQSEVLDKIQKDRPLLNRLAWENLMIKRTAGKDKITVSNREVVGFITRHPLFSRGTVFDDKLYNYILKNSLGMIPRVFEENVRNFLVNAKFKEAIIKNVTVSDEEALKSYKNELEKVKLSYAVIDKDFFRENVEVSESEITFFYEKNKELFAEPEKTVLQYVAFPHKEEGAKERVLSDLKASYEKLRRRGRDFEKTAKHLNLEVRETSPFSRDEIVSELENAGEASILSSRLRPLVDVIPLISENDIGTSYIIMVKEKLPPGIKSRELVSTYIKDILKDEEAKVLARREAENIYRAAEDKNMSLKKIADKYNLELRRTGFISRYDYVEGVGEAHKIVESALKLEVGALSSPIEVRKGFALIEPTEIEFIDVEKFESEKENYKNKVLTIKKMKALENWIKNEKVSSSLAVDLNRI
ncbi:MAG: SurA N-terminal domain-containing protein [Candidatus Omnitrophica bacterium]|nr:SurA N-terminal domain-containing protein [Candidatus Omnitrophota bacterium]